MKNDALGKERQSILDLRFWILDLLYTLGWSLKILDFVNFYFCRLLLLQEDNQLQIIFELDAMRNSAQRTDENRTLLTPDS